MSRYIMRLDDACEKWNKANWIRMEKLLDYYGIQPLVGIIPHCEDEMMNKYQVDEEFWSIVDKWIKKKWIIAMHGYDHVYLTQCGGINPVNKRSEFAGVPFHIQREKILKGIKIFEKHRLKPKVFFAPSHTFDNNTVLALKESSDIRIISDTIANKPYSDDGFTFVPQQSGKVRRIPLHTVTFCYHPNVMNETAFEELEMFLKKYSSKFIQFPLIAVQRKKNYLDVILEKIYFIRK